LDLKFIETAEQSDLTSADRYIFLFSGVHCARYTLLISKRQATEKTLKLCSQKASMRKHAKTT